MLEARLLSVLNDSQLSMDTKRQKLAGLCKKVADYGAYYKMDAKNLVHPKIMVEGVNKTLTRD